MVDESGNASRFAVSMGEEPCESARRDNGEMTDLATELQAIEPRAFAAPLAGYEHVRGFGVFAAPFDSGHVLALRVFPENDFAPYRTIWHRTPNGQWSIFVDGPRIDTACPRYYGAAAVRSVPAKTRLTWHGPMRLHIHMDDPPLDWEVVMTEHLLVRAVNAVSSAIPETLWRKPAMLRLFEVAADKLFDLGDVTLSGQVPNGHFGVLMPRRMYPIGEMRATLEGADLGRPARAPSNPMIGDLRLPARPTFAVGGAYFEMKDPVEYERTIAELRSRPSTSA